MGNFRMAEFMETNELIAQDAHKNFEDTVRVKRSINGGFIELARLLKENRDNQLYKLLDYDTFEAYIASPELSFRRATVYAFINIYETFIVGLGVEPARLSEHEWSKLLEILPHVNTDNYEELLSDVETLSRSDLRLKLKEDSRKRLADKNSDKTVSGVKLIHGDFRDSGIDDIDAIITDPPYPAEYIDLWQDLFYFASDKLKPSGFLVAYSGEINLDKIMKLNFGGLNYYWTFCLYHEGKTQLVLPRNVICRWKPILVFQKPPFKKLDIVAQDYVISHAPEKSEHDWQQSESGVTKLIETFSNEGDLVVDPFAGSGTFLKVAKELKRNAVGYEIDETTYNIAKGKLSD